MVVFQDPTSRYVKVGIFIGVTREMADKKFMLDEEKFMDMNKSRNLQQGSIGIFLVLGFLVVSLITQVMDVVRSSQSRVMIDNARIYASKESIIANINQMATVSGLYRVSLDPDYAHQTGNSALASCLVGDSSCVTDNTT
ncbi:MAG: hypothetical protein C5B49_02465, partial [Bdellovibrio sp.]